ncbi:MAG: LPXTG cell wall anchor domain-containing protein [Ilumatobacteraceae bacterium]|nr:LPXTG cell wall anchor domain-containing protein [Ilumatobacteraceae bacterium]
MRARTLGPMLMMTLGAALMFMPATGWVGAGDLDPCLELDSVGRFDPCLCPDLQSIGGGIDPCLCPDQQKGFVDPCEETIRTTEAPIITLASTTTLPATTTAAATTTLAPATTLAPTTAAATTTTDLGSGGQGLPATGSSSSGYVVLGGLLLVSGAALLVLGRSRPAQSTP